MAVGFIVVQTQWNPDDLVDAEVIFQNLFNLFFAQVRVAAGVQQALFGGVKSTVAVYMNRAPFQDDRRTVMASTSPGTVMTR